MKKTKSRRLTHFPMLILSLCGASCVSVDRLGVYSSKSLHHNIQMCEDNGRSIFIPPVFVYIFGNGKYDVTVRISLDEAVAVSDAVLSEIAIVHSEGGSVWTSKAPIIQDAILNTLRHDGAASRVIRFSFEIDEEIQGNDLWFNAKLILYGLGDKRIVEIREMIYLEKKTRFQEIIF